jgi:8-oxo-dGTP pyrophosphatase MutT (NUDIX family)
VEPLLIAHHQHMQTHYDKMTFMTAIPRNHATTASYLVLQKDNKTLFARRCNTGYQDGNYQVPAGHIDAGELPSEALIREVKEEIGITIDPEDVKFAHTSFRPMMDKTGDRVDYFFVVDVWQGEVTNCEPDKCDDLLWATVDEMPANTTPHVRIALEAINRSEPFSEISLDTLQKTGMY